MRNEVKDADKLSEERPKRRQRSLGRTLKGGTPRALELRIEEVVLYGFTPDDRIRIGHAMQQAFRANAQLESDLFVDAINPTGTRVLTGDGQN